MPSKTDHTVVLQVTPGEVLDGRWRLEDRVGQGAMGSVFQGRDLQTQLRVAIKVLAPEHCRKPKVIARFEREASLLIQLSHPNIVQLHGHGRLRALPYIVMEYLEGMTLSEVLTARRGSLSVSETVAIIRPVAAGLTFLHHHELVHRDIKPQNVFLTSQGRVTILDLGVVRDQHNPGLTKPGAMVGTPYYMSPEQILGVDDIDERTDVYALAAMTFELLTGRPPYLGTNNFEVLYGHRNSVVPNAADINEKVTKAVAQVLMRGMAKRRDDRQASASTFAAELENAASAKKVDLARAFPFIRAKFNPVADDTTVKKVVANPFAEGERTRLVATPEPMSSNEIPLVDSGEVVSIRSRDADFENDGAGPTMLLRTDTLLSSATQDESGPREARGSVRITASLRGTPVAASIFVDGNAVGRAPQLATLPPGRHKVVAKLAGSKTIERSVDVSAGTMVTIRLEF